MLRNNALFSHRYAVLWPTLKKLLFFLLKTSFIFFKKKTPCLRRWQFLWCAVFLSLCRIRDTVKTPLFPVLWARREFNPAPKQHLGISTKPLTWRGGPRPSSAQPVGLICRFWSWWWPRGRPGPGKPQRWRRWTGSGRRAATGGCQTRSLSAWCHASTTGR